MISPVSALSLISDPDLGLDPACFLKGVLMVQPRLYLSSKTSLSTPLD
jgi:hypothetical protein